VAVGCVSGVFLCNMDHIALSGLVVLVLA